jgi:hypothetical protein
MNRECIIFPALQAARTKIEAILYMYIIEDLFHWVFVYRLRLKVLLPCSLSFVVRQHRLLRLECRQRAFTLPATRVIITCGQGIVPGMTSCKEPDRS